MPSEHRFKHVSAFERLRVELIFPIAQMGQAWRLGRGLCSSEAVNLFTLRVILRSLDAPKCWIMGLSEALAQVLSTTSEGLVRQQVSQQRTFAER